MNRIGSLSYHYEMQGELIDLSEYDIEPYGYDMVIKNQNRSFVVNGDDPQFILSSTQGTLGKMLGGIELTFDSEWIEQTPLPIQIFYAKSGEDYTEKHSVKSALQMGEKMLRLPIPEGEYRTLRFDIDGNFGLDKIQGCTEKMKAKAYVSSSTIQTCIWYFPAITSNARIPRWKKRIWRCSIKRWLSKETPVFDGNSIIIMKRFRGRKSTTEWNPSMKTKSISYLRESRGDNKFVSVRHPQTCKYKSREEMRVK